MNGYVRAAEWSDLPILAENMRPHDKAEIFASSGACPLDALTEGMKQGDTKVACLPNGIPAAIFGVVPTPVSGVGSIWMLATNQFKNISRQFLRECRGEIADLTEEYRLVFNLVDARNTIHIRWIKWAGFTIIKRHEHFGFEQRPFLEFVLITE